MKYLRIVILLSIVTGLSFLGYKLFKPRSYNVTPEPEPPLVKFVDTTDPNDLLPDLAMLPARDLTIKKTDDGRTLLLFSTTYYNVGRGPMELRITENTEIFGDKERNVLQRIYLAAGDYRDVLVGRFLWHQQHAHYHFDEFVEYDLQPVDAPGSPDLSGTRIKSTFCLRDVSKVDIDLPNRVEEAGYGICGEKKQGVSVGWGDTYYFDYPAQNLNITDLPSGVYRFVTNVNPESHLQEINYANNTSSTLFSIDIENGTVTVLGEDPENNPPIEHVHLEEPFGMNGTR